MANYQVRRTPNQNIWKNRISRKYVFLYHERNGNMPEETLTLGFLCFQTSRGNKFSRGQRMANTSELPPYYNKGESLWKT